MGQSDDEGVHLGTGLLISRKHRLVATAAHLADNAITYDGLVAWRRWHASSYRVDGICVGSPRLIRTFDPGLYAESMDPSDGEVALPTFDVAVLHLAEGGPPLPRECSAC